MEVRVSKCCKLCNGFIVWWGVHGVKPLKDCGLFASEGQIKEIEMKPSKSMYFERNFNAKLLKIKFYED